jgi:phosphopantothenoylcysteine synthetase/decarboxylase
VSIKGFEADQNEVEMITGSGPPIHAGLADKGEIADRILDQVATLRLSVRAVDRSA